MYLSNEAGTVTCDCDDVCRKEGRQAVMGKFEWQIIPLSNPDGYEYTR
jgi:murein tripeptide amidase MpaA